MVFGRPLEPGEVRWLALCSARGEGIGSESPVDEEGAKCCGETVTPPLWQPVKPESFLTDVYEAGTTAPSGAVVPTTLPSGVEGYTEHIDANHRPFWRPLDTAARLPNLINGRLVRRPTKPLATPDNEENGMFGSAAVLVEEAMRQGRSVFGRRTAFAEKLGLPLDAVEPEEGLLSSGPQGWEELGLRPRTVGAVTEPYVVAADALRVAARSGVATNVGADIALEGAFFRDQEPAATDGEVSEWHGEKARARCAALLR